MVLLILGLITARVSTRWLGRLAQKRLKMEEGVAASVQSLMFYASVILVVIGLGFGSQNLMSNFISGVILLMERPIRVGDLVQVGDLHGTVTHIGLRSTRLVTPSNFELVLPNSSFLNDRVTN